MKLLTKTILYFLVVMVPLLIIAASYLFSQFSRELNHRMDEELIATEVQWIRYLQNEADNGTIFTLRTPELLIYPVNAPVTSYPTIKDIYDPRENKKTSYRQLSHIVAINNVPYQITIRQSQEQKTVLQANITRIMLFVLIGLLAATMLFNWFINERLWKPFRQSLQKIRNAELQKMQAMNFGKTKIEEFNELNGALNAMTKKIHDDFINMKEFTENAAHEMQTPLAVVQSKLELLLQDANLSDNQVQSIVDASTALNRLSKLNQSLLLLAKIENNQYETNTTISLTDVTKKYLKLFDELVKDKQLTVETFFNGDFSINLRALLADSLVSNLLGNAVKYNFIGGRIIINVTNNIFQISNTSKIAPIDPGQLFKRFNKYTVSSDTSNGLGLAIVKRICDTHHLTISYYAENGLHQFIITTQ